MTPPKNYSVLHVLMGPGGGAWGVVRTLANSQKAHRPVGIGLSVPSSGRQSDALREARAVTPYVFEHRFNDSVPLGSAIWRPNVIAWAREMTQRTGFRPVLHFHNGVAAGLFIPVIGKLPFPAVATFHAILPIDDEALHKASWRLPVHRILIKRSLAAGVVCAAVSNATAEHIRCRYRLPNGALRVVPNGVSQPEVAAPAFTRRAKCSIGFVGEIGARKNWYAAYEAIRLLRSSGHSVEIIFAGDGPDAQKLRETAASNQGVQYLGPRPTAKSDIIPHLDFLLLPSRSEGMPLVVLEALALGVPVIATAVGGIAEVVRDGIEGVILAGPDKESVRDGILRALLLNHAALAENCRYRYSANFTSLHMAGRYDLLYRKAIETFDRTAGNPGQGCT